MLAVPRRRLASAAASSRRLRPDRNCSISGAGLALRQRRVLRVHELDHRRAERGREDRDLPLLHARELRQVAERQVLGACVVPVTALTFRPRHCSQPATSSRSRARGDLARAAGRAARRRRTPPSRASCRCAAARTAPGSPRRRRALPRRSPAAALGAARSSQAWASSRRRASSIDCAIRGSRSSPASSAFCTSSSRSMTCSSAWRGVGRAASTPAAQLLHRDFRAVHPGDELARRVDCSAGSPPQPAAGRQAGARSDRRSAAPSVIPGSRSRAGAAPPTARRRQAGQERAASLGGAAPRAIEKTYGDRPARAHGARASAPARGREARPSAGAALRPPSGDRRRRTSTGRDAAAAAAAALSSRRRRAGRRPASSDEEEDCGGISSRCRC